MRTFLPKHSKLSSLLVLLLFFGRSTFSVAEAGLELAPSCDQFIKIPIPSADQPTAQDKESLKDCDAEVLYYGIGVPADPGRARLCAYIEMETAEEKTDTPLFESAGILLNIYANGKGAKRNIPLAKRMACIVWSAPAELEARLQRLSQIEAGKSLETEFDVCDDITSGRMGGECAAHQERISGAERNRYLSQVRGKLSASQQSLLSDLEKKLDAFITARSDGEIDQGCTIRMARLIGEEEVVRVQFADGIKTLIEGIFGDWKPADYKKADQELNEVYKRLQGHKEFIAEGVSAEGI